jgi:hypothetical protein
MRMQELAASFWRKADDDEMAIAATPTTSESASA